MPSTIPAQDLNNPKWSAYKHAQFGGFVLTQFWLLASCVVLLVALGAVGYEAYQNSQVIASFRPIVIRVDRTGDRDVVYLRDASYRPQEPEVKRDMADFIEKYYTRNKARLKDYYRSKYYLAPDLGIKSWAVDQRSGWIKKLITGEIEANDVVVGKVKVQNLATPPYEVMVDFTKIFYSDQQTESRREDYTATIQFVVADKVDNRTVEFNPFGFMITDFHADQAFH